ncbi:hypothetical protein B0O80DRAFT_439445 [Mortierella sp. GBAus27b]|nr:hypothetical protein B0O80DRAFT_439445 [Mortierella sp. GBAus27b]
MLSSDGGFLFSPLLNGSRTLPSPSLSVALFLSLPFFFFLNLSSMDDGDDDVFVLAGAVVVVAVVICLLYEDPPARNEHLVSLTLCNSDSLSASPTMVKRDGC